MIKKCLLSIEFSLNRGYKSFRKSLPLDYKKGNKNSHTNQHAIPNKRKDYLLKSKKGGDWKKINELERQSLKPYGTFTKTGFKFDKEKLPFFDIPNIDGFELQPYVEFNAPKLQNQKLNLQRNINQKKMRELLDSNKLPS